MHILLEDHHLIAVNKPAPLPTQAPAGFPSLEALVKAYLKEKYQKPAGVYLGIPHRLDQPVSGVVLFARNSKAAARVALQFQEHTVEKIYWGLVERELVVDHGEWRDQLRKVDGQARSEIIDAGTANAKEAITRFQVIRRFEGRTLVELIPRTGRMHQLRIQSASRGHPIVGDALYGSSQSWGPPAELPRDRIIALHARCLSLTHPFTRERLCIEAPLPEWWLDAAALLPANEPQSTGPN